VKFKKTSDIWYSLSSVSLDEVYNTLYTSKTEGV
jgi:hypothetical protein